MFNNVMTNALLTISLRSVIGNPLLEILALFASNIIWNLWPEKRKLHLKTCSLTYNTSYSNITLGNPVSKITTTGYASD